MATKNCDSPMISKPPHAARRDLPIEADVAHGGMAPTVRSATGFARVFGGKKVWSWLSQSRRAISTTLLILAGVALSGCGDSNGSAESTPIAESSLSYSVAYQRGDDVFVKDHDAEPRLLVRNATHPRWDPDGSRVATVSARNILVVDAHSGEATTVATAADPVTVAWHPSGERLFFTDRNMVRIVDLETQAVSTVVEGHRVLELDVAPDGTTLVGTVRRSGYAIRVFDLEAGNSRNIARGCSASISPDGKMVTNLLSGHRNLDLIKPANGDRVRLLDAPDGVVYDNQYWTNHPDWIAGELEGDKRDIVLINATDGRVRRVTDEGTASRGDVFIRSIGDSF
jgi:hypothetical protein